ncbi:MAG: 6-pyruvoyl tetrahydropterin synthase family protein [Planctomycetota bacterium]
MKRFGVRVYKEYFNFAAAHFLLFPDGGRERLHGHNYQVRVELEGELGPGEMVLDFCQLKPIVRRHCDALDHRLLLALEHPGLEVRPDEHEVEARFRRPDGRIERFVFPRDDVLLLPLRNTSTERLAELLAGRILADLDPADRARLRGFGVEVEEAAGQCGLCRLAFGDGSQA